MTKKAPSDKSYHDLRNELDDVMINIQAEDLDIDQALVLYKRGLELVKGLEQHINKAENEVKVLKAKFDSD
jgi:exodeoxyribonuclease VII small subunit